MRTIKINKTDKIIITNHLSKISKKNISDFIVVCNYSDHSNYDMFLENNWNDPALLNCFYIYLRQESIVSLLTLFCPDQKVVCFYALTKPECRQQKLFSILYQQANLELGKYPSIKKYEFHLSLNPSFSNQNHINLKILHHYNYRKSNHEFTLNYGLKNATSNGGKNINYDDLQLEFEENEYGNEFSLWKNETYIGGCLCDLDDETLSVTIFQFGIVDEYQGLGYGKSGLYLILKELRRRGYRNSLLQVAEKNKKAFNLYKGLGFSIVQDITIYSQSKK